jgi:hypothetical protein
VLAVGTTKKEVSTKADSAPNTFDTKKKASNLAQTNTSLTKEDVIPLAKRVPSGQSCSAFFLGDASTASGMSGVKKEATKRPLSKERKANKLPMAQKKAEIPAKLNEAKDVKTVEETILPENRAKEIVYKEKPVTTDKSMPSPAIHVTTKDVEVFEEADLPENPVKEIMSKEKPVAMAVTNAQDSPAKSKSLTIDTNLPPGFSNPMSPLFSPSKNEEFEVELPPIQNAPADEDGKNVVKSISEEKDLNKGKEDMLEERPSDGCNSMIATEKLQGDTKSPKTEPVLVEHEDAGTGKAGHIKKADSCCEVSVATEPPPDLKPISVSMPSEGGNSSSSHITGKAGHIKKADSCCEVSVAMEPPPDLKPISVSMPSEGGNSSSSHINAQVDRRQNISSHHSTSSSREFRKETSADNASRNSPPQIKMDEIRKLEAAPVGRIKKNDDKIVKKKQMILTSFLPTRLDKKSKVIEEDTEYVATEEENEVHNQVCPSVTKSERKSVEDHASDDVADLHLNATLSDCEFSSVQSSVTTDKAFEAQPSMLKKTSSFIRNPLLRRNRSKKTEMDELAQRIKNGKMAAKADNKVKEFEETTTKGEIQYTGDETIPPQIKTSKLRRILSARTEVSEGAEEHLSSEGTGSDGAEESNEDAGCIDKYSEKADSYAESVDPSEDDSSGIQGLVSKNTFDDTLTKHQAKLPDVNDSVKLEMRSPSFRLSAIGGQGAPKVPSPLAKQMTRVANDGTQTGDSSSYPFIRNMSTGISKEAPSRVSSADHGTQTSDLTPLRTFTFGDGAEYQPDTSTHPLAGNVSPIRQIRSIDLGIQTNHSSTQARSFGGTFGDVVESIGLFSARVCLGTGAAVASCSRACNDKPQGPILSSSSFVEPELQLLPRNAVFSPRNAAFREEPHTYATSGGYTQVLAEAISRMPEEEQFDLVQQLSNKPHRNAPTDEHHDDMDSSVDGMFRQRGVSRQKKRVPRNIAVKPKPKRTKEVPMAEQQNWEPPQEMKRVNSTDKKKPWFKRLAKKRLAVMYQV